MPPEGTAVPLDLRGAFVARPTMWRGPLQFEYANYLHIIRSYNIYIYMCIIYIYIHIIYIYILNKPYIYTYIYIYLTNLLQDIAQNDILVNYNQTEYCISFRIRSF